MSKYTKLSKVAKISGGIFGDEKAISRFLTKCFWLLSFIWAQQLTNPAANNSRPTKGCQKHIRSEIIEGKNICQSAISTTNETCNCASLAQVRRAGEGDSFSSWMLKCLIHSAQSSLVLRWEASPAVRNRPSLTCERKT